MSVIKHKEQRVGVFIDAQNLYHSAKNLHSGRVNFGEVLETALAGRQLVRAIAYVITTESGEESSFFEALNKVGIETKTKDLQIFSSGSKKADWDVGLAIDAVKLAPKLDVVVLASGDGDFVPLVEFLKMQGCQVEVITFGKSASGKLKEATDDFVDLDSDPARYVISHNYPRRESHRDGRRGGDRKHSDRQNREERKAAETTAAGPAQDTALATERREQGGGQGNAQTNRQQRGQSKIGGMRKVIRKIN